MTDDLIARLRDPYGGHSVHRAMMEAADTLERYKAALTAISDMCPATCEISTAHMMADIANEALNGEPS